MIYIYNRSTGRNAAASLYGPVIPCFWSTENVEI